MSVRNPHARALRDPAFRKRVVRKAKGRASYTRKTKHPKGNVTT